jgi:hypothetical protein
MTNAQPPTPIDTQAQIDMLLEEAEAFRRGGAPLDALARARVARDVLAERLDTIDDDDAEELSARVAYAIHTYERLAGLWQEESAERGNAYVEREQAALRDIRRDH